jgi:hypothetical protein
VDVIYDETAAEVDRVIDERDYTQALRLYNNKGLLSQIEPLFGFARKGMPELVKRLASAKEGTTVLSALREQLPEIENSEAETTSSLGRSSSDGAQPGGDC